MKPKPSEIIKKYGWAKGAYAKTGEREFKSLLDETFDEEIFLKQENDICFCALGAIMRAFNTCSFQGNAGEYFHTLSAKIDEIDPHGSIHGWNDAADTTKEDVITMLESVEKHLGL